MTVICKYAAMLFWIFFASSAQAAVIVNVQESGTDVVIDYYGSLNVSGTTLVYSFNSGRRAKADPSAGMISNVGYRWLAYSFPITKQTVFGSGKIKTASSYTGTIFGYQSTSTKYSDAVVFLPYTPWPGGYTGSLLSGTITFVGASLFSLGFTPGVYVTALPNDTITTNIIASDVPLPAAAPLLLGALALTGIAARRRKGRSGASIRSVPCGAGRGRAKPFR